MSETKPLKRSKELVTLSREHHDGLLLTWKINRGLQFSTPLQDIAEYILYFRNNNLQKHFRQEEKWLFIPHKHLRLCEEAMTQHRSLEQLMLQMEDEKNISEELLTTFADQLKEHIRFEERTVFPALEQLLAEDELISIGKQLNKNEKFIEQWKNEFWINKK